VYFPLIADILGLIASILSVVSFDASLEGIVWLASIFNQVIKEDGARKTKTPDNFSCHGRR
jgi:hypothetical protein